MERDDSWLLEPNTHCTNPIKEEKLSVKRYSISRDDIKVSVYHPDNSPTQCTKLNQDIALFASGWTEPRLENAARSLARVGMNAACFDHPRSGALSDLWSLLMASRKLRTNWRELSNAIWDEKDLEHAEHILIGMISDQIKDADDRKALFNSALKAGRSRIEDVVSIVDDLKQQDYNVHLVGHSLGGTDVTMAAKTVPEYVETISLAGPAGLMANDSLHDITKRVASTAIGERAEFFRNARGLARMAINTTLFVAENPFLTIYEGGFAATSRLETTLWDIMADYHIPSVLILGENDRMFPTRKVIEDSRTIPFAGKIILPKAGHNMTTHQSDDVARIVRNVALDRLDRKNGRLEANMHNLLERRVDPRKNHFTNEDLESDLFSRAS